jgi:hypothetical protein
VGTHNSEDRFLTLYGLILSSVAGGPLNMAREFAETFLREAEDARRVPETAVGLRSLGLVCLYQGEISKATEYIVRVLKVYNPERDREASIRYGPETGAAARLYVAVTKWYSGDLAQARKLTEEAFAYATQSGHTPTLSVVYFFKGWLEILFGDAVATLQTAETLVDLSQRHGLALWMMVGRYYSAGARAKLGDPRTCIPEVRQTLTPAIELGAKTFATNFMGLLARSKQRWEMQREPWPGSTRRWRLRQKQERTSSTRFCIGSAATSC